MPSLVRVVLVVGVLATSAVSAQAATAPVYWPLTTMTRLAPTLPGPLVTIDQFSSLTFVVGKPDCVGIGAVDARNRYPGFRCAVAWKKGVLRSGTGTLWVRPLAEGFCVSSTGFASCPAAPRADDPRLCATRGRRSATDSYAEYCAMKAARGLVAKAVRASGRIAVNLGCTVRTVMVYRCGWLGGSATVTFSLGETWTSKVVLA